MATQNSINNTSGGITVTGTANINTTGSAISSIGTGGTGATNIGNTTGNTAVSGSLTATTTLTATSGNITATNGSIVVGATAAAATAQDVDFLKSRSGSTITSGDTLGIVTFKGHDGTGYITASQIQSVNSGTVATNRIASNLLFYTHPDSTTASTLRMTISSTGSVTIASPDSGNGLTISGGDLVISNSNITLPANNGSTVGNLVSGGVVFINGRGSGNNVLIGAGAGSQNFNTAVCTNNVAIGINSMHAMVGGNLSSNVAIGASAMVNANSNCSNNVAIGNSALSTISSVGNNYNIAIGNSAGSSLPNGSGSSNVYISHVGASESNVIRLGTQGTGNSQQNKCFIAGIYNTSVGATSNVTLVDSNGQIGGLAGSANTVLVGGTAPSFTASPSVSGSITAGTGITVTAGGITFTTTGTNGITSIDTFGRTIGGSGIPVLVDNTGLFGTVASSARFKHDIVDMADSSDALMQLRPVMFTYNASEDGVRSPGLIAEEVADVMPDLVSYDQDGLPYTVKYNDLPAMLLNEIQKLRKRIEILEAKNGI